MCLHVSLSPSTLSTSTYQTYTQPAQSEWLHTLTPVWFFTPIKVFTLARLEPSGHGDTIHDGESCQVPHIKGCLFRGATKSQLLRVHGHGSPKKTVEPQGRHTWPQRSLQGWEISVLIAFATGMWNHCESVRAYSVLTVNNSKYIPEHSQQSPLEVRKDCEPRNRQQSLKMNDPLVLSPVHISPAKQLITVWPAAAELFLCVYTL